MWNLHKQCSHIVNIFEGVEVPANKGNLYLSGVYVLQNPEVRKNLGINCVLTIIDQWAYNHFKVEHKIKSHGIDHHKWINLEDVEEESIYPHLEDSHSFIRDKLQDHNVLVHCQMGISRSSSLIIAFLMKEFGMTFNQARELVRSKRQIICPNEGFTKELQKFEKHLQKQKNNAKQ